MNGKRKVFNKTASGKIYPFPVNKSSKITVSKTEEVVSDYRINAIHSLERLPTTQFTGKKSSDLTGARQGELTVIGVFLKQNPKAKGNTRWVVLCGCGYYEVRSTRAIKNKNNKGDCCSRCQKNKYNARQLYLTQPSI